MSATTNKLNSLSELKNSLETNMEIFFRYNKKRYMLAPDPSTSESNSQWILVSQGNEDHPVKLTSIDAVMNYQIGKRPIKSIWKDFTDVEL